MPQSFQVILLVQIPVVMHGACCQISWLKELSVLPPGCSVGLYDILQPIQEASATISSPGEHQQLGHTPALGLNAGSLSFSSSYCNALTYSNIFSVFLALLALIMSCHSHNFLAFNSNPP